MIHPKLTHGQASGRVLNKALKAKLSFSAFAANCVKTPQFCRRVFAAGASAGGSLVPGSNRGIGAVLLRSVSTYLAQTLGFGAIADGLAVVEAAGYVRLIYTSRDENQARVQTLDPVADTEDDAALPNSDLAIQQTGSLPRLFIYSAYSAPLRVATLTATGSLGAAVVAVSTTGSPSGVTAVEIIEGGATDIAVVATRYSAGLQIFSLTDAGEMSLTGTITDAEKSYLGNVSDLASLTINGAPVLLVLSSLENGISSYHIAANGTAELIDSLGAMEGLAVNGPAALQVAQIGGQHFAVIASTLSDSLTVVRINDMGVLFAADHVIDDRNTRFDAVAALDIFEAKGRSFVVTGGSDAGLSLFELLPGGQLSHLQSFALETGAGIGAITSIETKVNGDKAMIFLVDAAGDRIYHQELALTALGDLIQAAGGVATGGALEDRILGSATADTLRGMAGDDFLHDGAGADLLYGGAGADVFVFARDGAQDRIADFEKGIDRIDLSDWGRIYSAGAVTIAATATGALVSFGAERLVIDSLSGQSLTAASFTDADFLF
jgi:hypothetical protein